MTVMQRVLIFTGAIILAIVGMFFSAGCEQAKTRTLAYTVTIKDASSGKPIGAAIVTITPSGRPNLESQTSQTNPSGSAAFTLGATTDLNHVTVKVQHPDFESGNLDVVLPGRDYETEIALRPKTSIPPPKPDKIDEPSIYSRTYTSGTSISGAGAGFSNWYEVAADPPRPGYRINTDPTKTHYSLSGDRACNAWSECQWGVLNEQQAVFRFRLQGHNEWPQPGQAASIGTLTVDT